MPVDFSELVNDDEKPLLIDLVYVWRSILLFYSRGHAFFTLNFWTGRESRIDLLDSRNVSYRQVIRGISLILAIMTTI